MNRNHDALPISAFSSYVNSCGSNHVSPSRAVVREFVIGTKKEMLYSRLNPYSLGGVRNGEWYTDVADMVLESCPKGVGQAVVGIKKKVLEARAQLDVLNP